MRRTKKIAIFFFALLMVLSMPLAAQAVEVTSGVNETAMETTISPRADVIVVKFRIYNGVLQCRRWNETWGYWVDPYWLNVV